MLNYFGQAVKFSPFAVTLCYGTETIGMLYLVWNKTLAEWEAGLLLGETAKREYPLACFKHVTELLRDPVCWPRFLDKLYFMVDSGKIENIRFAERIGLQYIKVVPDYFEGRNALVFTYTRPSLALLP